MAKKTDIEIKMEQEACVDIISDAIREVQAQLAELSDLGVEALESGDQDTIDALLMNICYVDGELTKLKSLKVNTKMQFMTNRITEIMVNTMTTMSRAASSIQLPNSKKMLKIQQQLNKSAMDTKQARQQIARITSSTNPANRAALTSDQKAQAMALIQARHVSKTGGFVGADSKLWDEVKAEKNTTL